MYNSIYETMVKAGVAKKLENVTFFDSNGNAVEETHPDANKIPTKYQVIKPELILYMDETGKIQT